MQNVSLYEPLEATAKHLEHQISYLFVFLYVRENIFNFWHEYHWL